eukprot:scaffold97522_cov69-Phaeocystis_antarctica.AAC.2
MPAVHRARRPASFAKESGACAPAAPGCSFCGIVWQRFACAGRSATHAWTRRVNGLESGRKLGEATAQRATHTKTANEPKDRSRGNMTSNAAITKRRRCHKVLSTGQNGPHVRLPTHSTMRSASIAVLLAVSATALRTPSAQPRTVPASATEHVASCGRRAALLAGAAAALGAQSPALAAEPSAGSCCRMQMQMQTAMQMQKQTQTQIERTQLGSTANHARAPEASEPAHALTTRNAHRSLLTALSTRHDPRLTLRSKRRRVGGAQGQLRQQLLPRLQDQPGGLPVQVRRGRRGREA